MTAKHKCSTKVRGAYRDVSGPIYPCRRPATVQHDGKWYCWQHDPERVKANKEKCKAAWNAEADRKAAIWKRRAYNARLAELVTPELAALLERLAEIVPAWGDWADHRADLDKARALAARIREALEASNEG